MPSILDLTATVVADTSDFDAKMSSAGQSVDNFASKASTALSGAANFGAASLAMSAGAGVMAMGIMDAVNSAADFEFQMDAVAAATGATGSQFADLEAQALSLGATSKFSAGEVAGVQEELGKAGISATQLMDGATQSVLDLSAATGEDLTTSSQSAAAAMNLFGLEANQIPGIADTFTAGLNNSSASLTDFQMGMNNLGPVMTNLARYAEDPQKAFTDTAAAVAYFNSQGLKAADAGVSLARGMTNLADPTSDASALMTELGISAFDAEGNFLALPDIMDQLKVGMSGMSDSAREAALATIFGAEAADVMNIAIKNGGDGLRDYEGLMVSSGQAAEQAAIRQGNFTGAMESLNGSIEGAKIAFGMAFLPVLTQVVQGITELVNIFNTLPAPIQQAIALVTAGVAAFLAVGSAIGFIIGPLGAFLAALAPVAAGVAAIALPLTLVVAGLAALYIAYQTNFLGFADGVNAAAALVGEGLSNLALLAQNVATAFGEGGLGAALGVLGDAFSTAFSNIQTAISNIDWSAISATLQTGLQTASDAILTWVGEQSTNLLTGFQQAWDGISAAVAPAWATIQAAISAAWTTIQTDIGTALTTIQTDIGTALTTIQTTISTAWTGVETALSATLETIKSTVLAAWTSVQESVALAMQTITETLSNTWTGIETAINTALTAIDAAVSTAWTAIMTSIETAMTTIQTSISTAWTTIQTDIGTALTTVQTTIATAWTGIETTLSATLETVKSTVLAAWTSVQETVALAMQTITTTLSDTWTGIQTTLSTTMTAIQTGIETAWTAIQTAITTAMDAVGTAVATGWETIQTTISTAQEDIATGITTVWTAISDFIGVVVTSLGTVVSAGFEAIKTTITTTATEAKDGFVTTITALKDEAITALGGIKDAIIGVFADAGGWLLDAGASIIGGLVQGITDNIPLIGGAMDLAASAAGGAGSFIDEHRPGGSGGGGGQSSGGSSSPGVVNPGSASRRALGGPVSARQSYWVGEDGPEWFMPNSSGTIIPNGASMGVAGGTTIQNNAPAVMIQNVNLRDERDLERYVKDVQRSARVGAGRAA